MTEAQKVLYIHAGALGDFVLATTLMQQLFPPPRCTLQALCASRLACFYAKRGDLCGWKSLDNPIMLPLFSDGTTNADPLRSYLNTFHVIVSYLGDRHSAAGRRLERLFDSDIYHIDPKMRPQTEQDQLHILSQWLHDLQGQGLSTDQLTENPPARCPSAALSDKVLIHPGSGGRSKRWELNSFCRLARRLQEQDLGVMFMLGPVEMEQYGKLEHRALNGSAPIIYGDDICRAAATLLDYRVYIGNDSGMSHLAAAMGLPTVVIFVSTSPALWRPIGPAVYVMTAPDVESVVDAVIQLNGER